MASRRRLVVVSNRLPVRRVRRGGSTAWEQSPGGLVTALAPILKSARGAWIGWAGGSGRAPAPFTLEGVRYTPVSLSRGQLEDFYEGFSNRTLWPLYHDAVRAPEFRRRWWWPYVDVNRKYAEAAAATAKRGDLVWVHDYHLQLVPAMLRELRPDVRIAFFLHIPFPPDELFAHMPWRSQIIEGLLGADLIGFQTPTGVRHFMATARRVAGVHGSRGTLSTGGRHVRVGAYPISIDLAAFDRLARAPETAARLHRLRVRLGRDRRVILGVDRLDYSKGIDARLKAVAELLTSGRATPADTVFVQVAVPSRESVKEYAELREEVERLVGRINGEFGEPGLAPVHYLHRGLPQAELVSHYLAADVMLVTPFRDGMNLVAKEYVACRTDDTGALVLSEFAGAAHELKAALMVNPHDVDGLAAGIDAALHMPHAEGARRMRSLRRAVRHNTVFDWADEYLGAAWS
ncbi:MAG: trehalose-6-phosphate synthase [Planctomycetota bacterium]|nr:MAG: trehalose-6-phosphate synthase [Planctomycetota bacterium]